MVILLLIRIFGIGQSQSAVHRGRYSHFSRSSSSTLQISSLNPLFIAANILTEPCDADKGMEPFSLNPLFIAANILTLLNRLTFLRDLGIGLNPLFIAANILTQ